jgi:hypothetical protein
LCGAAERGLTVKELPENNVVIDNFTVPAAQVMSIRVPEIPEMWLYCYT